MTPLASSGASATRTPPGCRCETRRRPCRGSAARRAHAAAPCIPPRACDAGCVAGPAGAGTLPAVRPHAPCPGTGCRGARASAATACAPASGPLLLLSWYCRLVPVGGAQGAGRACAAKVGPSSNTMSPHETRPCAAAAFAPQVHVCCVCQMIMSCIRTQVCALRRARKRALAGRPAIHAVLLRLASGAAAGVLRAQIRRLCEGKPVLASCGTGDFAPGRATACIVAQQPARAALLPCHPASVA